MALTTVFMRFRHLWQDLIHPQAQVKAAEQPSAELQAIYRGAFEQSHSAIFISDLNGDYLHANRRARELLGYTAQDIRQVTVEDISAEVSESKAIIKRLLTGESIPPYERLLLKKDGTNMVGEINVELVHDADGKPLHIQTVIHDIQQRKQAQEQVHRQNEYLTALHRITLDLLNRRDRNDLLQSVVNYAAEIINVPYVEIRIREDDELVTYACTDNQSFAKGDRGRRDQVVYTWQAYDTQKVVIVEDYSTSPLRRDLYQSIPFHAVAYFPIIARQACLGVLDLSRIEPNKPFTTEEIQQGTLFAQLVALLLDNVNLHEAAANEIEHRKQAETQVQRQNEYLTAMYRITLDLLNRRNRDDLLQSIITHCSTVINVSYVEISLKEGDEMVTSACTPNIRYLLGDRATRDVAPLVWEAYDTHHYVTVGDYSSYALRRSIYDDTPTGAIACFPILVGQDCVGTLDIGRLEKDHPFTAEELQQGIGFAQLVALLLDNANLHEAAAREILQRKQTEENLRAVEQRQRALLNAIPDLIFRFDKDGTYLDYHAPNPDKLAFPPEHLIGQRITDVLPPELSAVHTKILKEVLETGKEAQYEYDLQLKDGLNYFESRMVVSGQDEVLTINRDITERKNMELRDSAFLQDMKALQEIFLQLSQINDLQLLYSSMVRLTQQRLKIDRVALFIIDPNTGELCGTYGVDTNGNIRNESYYREMITSTHWTLPILNSPKHAIFWEEMPVFDNGIQVGIGWKTVAALWDGTASIGYLVTDNFINQQPPRSYQDELSSLLGSTYGHLIRLKQTQITLHQSEERHRALLSAIPDLMFRFDRNGTFLDYHSSDAKSLIVPPEQFLGRRINEVMPPDVAALQTHHMKQVLQTGQEALYEYSLPVNGKPAYYESRMVASGKDEVMTIIRDITERKELEEQSYALVMETARANVLGQFVQNASHELRTPLSTINTALYLMTKTDDEAKHQTYADRAADHIRQLSRLLDMVLSMTKLDSMIALDIQAIDLNDWVRRVDNAAQDQVLQKGITATFIPDLGLPPIPADPVWLQEAFVNLLDNAIRFTPEGGTITIRTYSKDGYAVVEFKDTGVGIPNDALPHIFERFWRQDEAHSTPGFGLGLSIALKIVEMHEGRIDVDSKVGSGSNFKIRLPLPPDAD